MTRTEFYQKYGSAMVRFGSYYKYTFHFIGQLPSGETISVDVGGNADDIYRFDVSAGFEHSVLDLQPYAGQVTEGGQIKESFYDY